MVGGKRPKEDRCANPHSVYHWRLPHCTAVLRSKPSPKAPSSVPCDWVCYSAPLGPAFARPQLSNRGQKLGSQAPRPASQSAIRIWTRLTDCFTQRGLASGTDKEAPHATHVVPQTTRSGCIVSCRTYPFPSCSLLVVVEEAVEVLRQLHSPFSLKRFNWAPFVSFHSA